MKTIHIVSTINERNITQKSIGLGFLYDFDTELRNALNSANLILVSTQDEETHGRYDTKLYVFRNSSDGMLLCVRAIYCANTNRSIEEFDFKIKASRATGKVELSTIYYKV